MKLTELSDTCGNSLSSLIVTSRKPWLVKLTEFLNYGWWWCWRGLWLHRDEGRWRASNEFSREDEEVVRAKM